MKFEVYTQDGFNPKGTMEFQNLEELMNFVRLHKDDGGISLTEEAIFIRNSGKKDLF